MSQERKSRSRGAYYIREIAEETFLDPLGWPCSGCKRHYGERATSVVCQTCFGTYCYTCSRNEGFCEPCRNDVEYVAAGGIKDYTDAFGR